MMRLLVLDYSPEVGKVIDVQKVKYKVEQVRYGFRSKKFLVVATPVKRRR